MINVKLYHCVMYRRSAYVMCVWLCLVTDCQPMIDDLDVLLGRLQKTRNWNQFIGSVRHRFTQLVQLPADVAGM